MSANDIRAGGAYVEIFTENSRLARGLKQAQSMISGWGAGLRSIGAKLTAPLALAGVTGIAGIVALGSELGEFGGAVEDMATRTGMSTQAVTELGHAAEMSGTDIETLEGGLTKMQRLVADAASGSKAANAQLSELGITADQIEPDPDAQLELFADRIAAITDPAARTSAAMAVFGKSGQKLLPLLADGAAGIQELRQEAVELGRSMSKDDVSAANELGDTIDKLKGSIKAATFSIAATFAPALTTGFEWLAKAAGATARWIRENRGLILGAIAGAAALAGLGVLIMGVGFGLQVLSMAIGAAVTLWAGLGAAIAFAANPVTWLVVGLAALTAGVLYFTGAGSSALAWFGQAWGVFRSEASDAWGAIVSALSAGDLQGAFEVAVAFIRLQWLKGTQFLESVWVEFRDAFLDGWSIAQGFIAAAWINTGAVLETAWVSTLDFLFDAWDAFTSRFMNGWRTAQNFVGKGFAWLIAKMEGLDPNAVMAEMDADLARRNGVASGAASGAINGRAAERAKRLGEIESRRQGALGENSQMTADQIAARMKARDAAAGDEQEALTKAQARFAAAVEKAKAAETKGTNGPTAAAGAAAFRPGAERSQKLVDAADIRTSEGLKQVLTAFTGGGADAQTAANTAKTNDKLDEANEKLNDQNGLLDDILRGTGLGGTSLQEAGT